MFIYVHTLIEGCLQAQGQINSFQEILENIFLPLFQVTINPESNRPLSIFLGQESGTQLINIIITFVFLQIVGFDCVDDESKVELMKNARRLPEPSEWTISHDPPYAYWLYYIYANLNALNMLRASKGMSTFALRPHSGEAGDTSHISHLVFYGIVK